MPALQLAAHQTTDVAQLHPSYFVGHAGVGLLFSENLDPVCENLREVGREILALQPRPKAIIVLSGHFEAGEIHGPGVIEVNVHRQSPIWHDYVNDFHDSHPFVYEYEWPHKDAPELGAEVWRHLKAAGIKTKRVERGVDHGVWVPFKIMFPDETPLDVPIVLVSTFHGYDLSSQLRLGEALSELRSQGFLIVASGMAVHSFPGIAEVQAASAEDRLAVRERVKQEAASFDAALRAAASRHQLADRKQALLDLGKLPEFKRAHPTVEHLTPVYVAAAAAGDAKVETVGRDVIEPGFTYTNFRFTSASASA